MSIALWLALGCAMLLDFVASFIITDSPTEVSAPIRQTWGWSVTGLSDNLNWQSALRYLMERIEAAGVLIAVDGRTRQYLLAQIGSV